MRGKWNHLAPAGHQPLPADNTSKIIRAQVAEWRASGRLIHPEIAMQIAAEWQSPAARDASMTAFGSTGTILRDGSERLILDVIARNIRDLPEMVAADPDGFTADDLGTEQQNVDALRALWAYVGRARMAR